MPVNGDFVLEARQRTDIPCNVVAPTLQQFTNNNKILI